MPKPLFSLKHLMLAASFHTLLYFSPSSWGAGGACLSDDDCFAGETCYQGTCHGPSFLSVAKVKKSVKVEDLTSSSSHILLVAGQCAKELGDLMKISNFIGNVKSTRVTLVDGDHKTVTETIEVTGSKGGFPFSEVETVETLKMVGVIFDSNLACDSANCTTYHCSIKK